MVTEKIKYNAKDIKAELDWFRDILKVRSNLNAKKESTYKDVFEVMPPHYNGSISGYASFIKEFDLNFEERFALMLGLVPHIKPELLDMFLARNDHTQQVYTEFGGKRGKHHNGFLPTGETLMFILAGNDMERRFMLMRLFSPDHTFVKQNILTLEEVDQGEPALNGAITISAEMLDRFTIGEVQKPRFSADFPAKLLTTKMDWKDLVLNPATFARYQEIEIWLEHHVTLMKDWGMEKKLKPGFKALFYGPPGTGKTLTATLLGKKTGRDVFKIDLSRIVSKYIGETEKNLSKIFDKAENKDWILFFDEADALFGKRTNVSDAHDRYANQEVAYLLQRIEDYNGLVILASNMKSNIDDAFLRRFNSIIYFPMPKADERLQIWKKGFSHKTKLAKNVDLKEIAKKYEMSGGPIMNVVQYSSLMALKKGSDIISLKDIVDGIKKEFGKSGRTT